MHILWMAIIGLVIGALAKLVMPGRDPGGVIVTSLIGIAGAMTAGMLGRAAGWYREGEPAGFIASVLGAILLLAIYRAVVGRRGTLTGGGPLIR
ncbi:MAG TPA: GlsB/YeaQ/YmgE family stress response membrane protein [Kofleriaceae bacterium]|nr:GlsB/YeaQ/YmgE family stress response membrane protein [Kofleriaceae bacterium]